MSFHGMVDTGHARVYCRVLGRGTPLLLLHGNGQTHRVFLPFLRPLARRFLVILMDSRGHGRSSLPACGCEGKREFSTADMADDALGLLKALGIRRAAILGFSDGANVGLEFACRYPESLLALICVSGNAAPDGLAAPVRLGALLSYGSARLAGRALRELETCTGCRRILRRLLAALSRRQAQSRLLLSSPCLTDAQLASIACPVLLIAGTRDLIPTPHTRRMARLIPQSHLILDRGGTHSSLFRHRRRYLGYILKFLAELGLM